jgi:hypothetical protein
MTARPDRADSKDSTEKAEPTENSEAKEPTEPTDNAEPTEPMDSTEPRDPIDRNESCDHSDHRDEPGPGNSLRMISSWRAVFSMAPRRWRAVVAGAHGGPAGRYDRLRYEAEILSFIVGAMS